MSQENIEVKESEQSIPVLDEKKKFKKPQLKTILISIIAFLVVILVIGILIIIFSPKEEPVVENIEPVVQEEIIEEKEPEVKFDLSSINSQKLNEQLAALTNKNIQKEQEPVIEDEESRRVLEEQKRIEEESLRIEEDLVLRQKESLEEKKAELESEMQKLEALKQEAIMAKEELQRAKITNTFNEVKDNQVEEDNTKEEVNNVQEKEPIVDNEDFLKLINVAKIKGVLYKKYLDKATNLDPNILLCRDDSNRIELYYGPFTSNELRENLLNRLLKNGFSQAYELEMTKEEFNKRCNY
ncbi:hypothetical protein [Arcobacter vandammei]|uniref:hypothetical protein n=1 Tax=Arcobacter vandammei TaxID=2782243 RepID=UPI0018DF7187|nr:hypothetical protein [Arcobacter vandammei]